MFPRFTMNVVEEAFLQLWNGLVSFLPSLVGAALVFLIGLVIATAARHVVERIVSVLRIDELFERFEVKRTFARFGLSLHVGHILGWMVKWFTVIVFLIAATDILGWDQVTMYLRQVVSYIPNVLIAVFILLVGSVVASFVQRVVRSAVEASRLTSAGFLAGLAKWSILVFSFMAALVQLQIAKELIATLFTGLVGMVALAGGLAFGLGGRDHAARFLDRLRKDISSEQL